MNKATIICENPMCSPVRIGAEFIGMAFAVLFNRRMMTGKGRIVPIVVSADSIPGQTWIMGVSSRHGDTLSVPRSFSGMAVRGAGQDDRRIRRGEIRKIEDGS